MTKVKITWIMLFGHCKSGHHLAHSRDNYSVVANFAESFSFDSSTTTEFMVIELSMRQSYQNCEVSLKSKFNGETPMWPRHKATKIFAKQTILQN